MLYPNFTIERSNSRYLMVSLGVGRISTPVFGIISTSTGEMIHMGKRKHIVELWNTRYNFQRARSYSNS